MLIFLISLSAGAVWAADSFRTPFSNRLERVVRGKQRVALNPGTGRLMFMRYYPPSNEIPEEAGFFAKLFGWGNTDSQAYYTAVYLFNMYVSAAAYGEDVPARLTTDYLGVLDSFAFGDSMYKTEDAEKFYNKNKKKIKAGLMLFFQHIKMDAYYIPNDPANDRRELAFMRLLAQAPVYRGRPGYYASVQNRMTEKTKAEDLRLLAQQLRRTLTRNKNKVVTFEHAYVRGEDLDRKVGVKSSNVERTYRCVNDECEYCSYEMGKYICREAKSPLLQGWGFMRVYKITALPSVPGGPLVPAEGTRFKLPSGQLAPKWNYHTAILVVINRDGRYSPVVADKFLVGEGAVSLEKWMKAFSLQNTVFFVTPFERSQKVEEAIKTVEARNGNTVKAGGCVYNPAPIEW